MEDDGFTLVTGKKGGKRGGYVKKGDTHIRVDGSLEDIEKSFITAEKIVRNSGLVEWLVDRFSDFSITEIVILGNGHFDNAHEPGVHQLALFLNLAHGLKITNTVFQDPVITDSEKSWLDSKKIEIRSGPDVDIDVNSSTKTLVGLIHGEHDILEQFLKHNLKHLDIIAVLGNNYGAMICSLASELGALKLVSSSSKILISTRNLPARGTKPLPRYLWDMEDLKNKSGGEYTHKPLRINRLGGRNPETGRKVNQHIGGGVKFDYFMIDFHRRGPVDPVATYDERILEVRRDPNRTCHIALAAGVEGKRWILATENMKAGDIISTTSHISENPVIGIEGNAYPIGSLAAGTLINSIERYPTNDSEIFVQAAGAAATIVRHQGDFTVVKLPHKHEFSLHRSCMATVGRLSHADIDNKIYGSAQMHRRFGYKMSSGLFHKKDGYFGRKIRALPPVRQLDTPPAAPPPTQRFTLTKQELSGLHGHAKVHNLLAHGYSTRDYQD